MIVRAPRPQSNFTVISNGIINESRLTWKARGLLIYLLSKPDHWRTTTAWLAAQSMDGIASVRTGMNELERLGYIRRVKTQDTLGRWSTHTIIYDQPVDNPGENWLTYPQPKSGFPTSENRSA